MADTDEAVANHYTTGSLLERIKAGLAALGADPESPKPEDLKPVDEFHIGGVQATKDLLAQVEVPADARVLDIGSGLGGAARLMATNFGAKVTGVDLTPEYVETSRALSALAGVDGVEFIHGSALDLPVDSGSYDLATLFHVGMNIADKATLMREAKRALRRGGFFAVYEVMQVPGGGDLPYPLPWAETPDFSFTATPDEYVAAAEAAGFKVVASRGRREFAIAFFEKFRAALAASGPPPLGLHLLMGETAKQKVAHMLKSITENRIEPTELILRAA